jgi:hypothetical protein
MPFESAVSRFFQWGDASFTRSRVARARDFASPAESPEIIPSPTSQSNEPMLPGTASASGQYAIRAWTIGLFHGCSPKTRIVPELGLIWPSSNRKSVVFPAPLGPTTPVMPGRMANETLFNPRIIP